MRVKIAQVPFDFVARLLLGHQDMAAIYSNLPPDIKVLGMGIEDSRRTLRVSIESSEFEDVPEGFFAPNVDPLFTTITPEDVYLRAATPIPTHCPQCGHDLVNPS